LFCLFAPIADLVASAFRQFGAVTSKTGTSPHLPTIYLTMRDPWRLAACIELKTALERPHAAALRLRAIRSRRKVSGDYKFYKRSNKLSDRDNERSPEITIHQSRPSALGLRDDEGAGGEPSARHDCLRQQGVTTCRAGAARSMTAAACRKIAHDRLLGAF
jgi:hypothetical protein